MGSMTGNSALNANAKDLPRWSASIDRPCPSLASNVAAWPCLRKDDQRFPSTGPLRFICATQLEKARHGILHCVLRPIRLESTPRGSHRAASAHLRENWSVHWDLRSLSHSQAEAEGPHKTYPGTTSSGSPESTTSRPWVPARYRLPGSRRVGRPIATLVLVLVIWRSIPVYSQVASRSYVGRLEKSHDCSVRRLLPGWAGKVFVLGCWVFASTDFVITMISLRRDAAQHVVANPFLAPASPAPPARYLPAPRPLAAVFLRGSGRRGAVLPDSSCLPYLALNVIVIARGCNELLFRPALLEGWRSALSLRGSPQALILASILVFPQLALGINGFETGVSVMRWCAGFRIGGPPLGFGSGTRVLMLLTAALLMKGLLLGSSMVMTLLVPAAAMSPAQRASGRAALVPRPSPVGPRASVRFL